MMLEATRREQKGDDAEQGHDKEYRVPAQIAEDCGASQRRNERDDCTGGRNIGKRTLEC